MRQEGLLGAEVPLELLLFHYRASTAATSPFLSFPTCTMNIAITFASRRGAVELN